MPVDEPSYDAVTPRFETTRSSHGRGWNHLQVYCYKLEPQLAPVVTPAGVPTATTSTHSIVLAHLYLSSELVTTIAEELARASTEVVPHSYFRDPFIEQACSALVGELEATGPLVAPRRGLSRRRLKLVIDHVKGPFLAGRLAIGIWMVMFGALGWALYTCAPALEARSAPCGGRGR